MVQINQALSSMVALSDPPDLRPWPDPLRVRVVLVSPLVKEVMISSATTTTQLPSKHRFYYRPPEMPEPPDPPDPASTPSLLSTNPSTSPRCTSGLPASTVILVTRNEGCSGDALKPTSQFDHRWSFRSPQTVSTLPCSLPVLLPRLCSHTYSLNHHHCTTLSPYAPWPCAHGDKLQRAAQPCLLRATPDLKPPHLLLWRWSPFPPDSPFTTKLLHRNHIVSSTKNVGLLGLIGLKGLVQSLEGCLGIKMNGVRLGRNMKLAIFMVLMLPIFQIVGSTAFDWQLGIEYKSMSDDSMVTRTKARAALEECKRLFSVKSDFFHMGRAIPFGSTVSKLHGVIHDLSFDVICFSFILASFAFVTETSKLISTDKLTPQNQHLSLSL
ncbi:hypothetical protein AALP_AA6G023100 [Arabis alpina]|uniref:Uncharacterized protein n=1 Tax=Arabis alpina TaxID=50452 RepID=A0A087GLL0_ARAAL|nr:hypothetical protein AALP_AA6G023100 [Arabis alpina]